MWTSSPRRLPGQLDRFVDLRGHRRPRRVLEADRVEGHAVVEDVLEGLHVELGRVRPGTQPGRQLHQRDHHDFVLEPRLRDATPRVGQVPHVVQGVEVADRRHAVLLEHAAIGQVVALAILMPIVASMGGNAGTQTLTVAVRSLARKT